MQAIEISPLDTLFFRGAEPMEAGESHFNSFLFPPMPSTLMGALRTGIMVQNKVEFSDFHRGKLPSEILRNVLGTPEKSGFNLVGPLFLVRIGKEKIPFFPAPAFWFTGIEEKHEATEKNDSKKPKKIRVIHSKPLLSAAMDFGITSSLSVSGKRWLWTSDEKELELSSCSSHWVNEAALQTTSGSEIQLLSTKELDHGKLLDIDMNMPLILKEESLFVKEPRVGVGRDNSTRQHKDGRLFSTTHIRLKERVSLLLFTDMDLLNQDILAESGNLILGGEQRTVHYQAFELDITILKKTEGKIWIALTPFPATNLPKHCEGLASGKIIRAGGWSMKPDKDKGKDRGFHKPLEGWYPAGTTLFFEKKQTLESGFLAID